jgi:hypothetical protein
MSKLNNEVDTSFWSATQTVGGLDTEMRLLGNDDLCIVVVRHLHWYHS